MLVMLIMAGCLAPSEECASQDSEGVGDTSGVDSEGGDTSGGETALPTPECEPPERQVLAEIPDDPSLEDESSDVLAVFEVEGDLLVGKFVVDEAAAEGALGLWQELVLRIPLNQRSQLVQFTLFQDEDLAGYVNNTGTDNQTGRYGPSLYLSVSNIEDNDLDVCAPLTGRRGTFDWTLIHEFGHLRQYADGSVNDFTAAFQTPTGDGEGYPEDGSPSLEGDFVTSYAERAGGDEDAAESFTTFVMLEALPEQDSLAAEKVRFFSELPGYNELRLALRVTEPGGGAEVPDAPLVEYPMEVENPDWLLGSWSGAGPLGPVEYVFEAEELIFRQTVEGEVEEVRYSALRDGGDLATVKVLESSESFHLYQVAINDSGYSETFSLQGQTVLVEKEHLGTFTIVRDESP